MTEPTSWHRQEAAAVLSALHIDRGAGLSAAEAAQRLKRYGPNLLREPERISPWRLFFAQFQDRMVLILLGATAVSFFLGEVGDAVTIVAIVILNALLGFVQEYRAEKSLEALKKLTAPTARVRRGGEDTVVPAVDLVPGDLLLLEAGDRVPADARLIECFGLEVEEAALTGESHPVRKTPDVIETGHAGQNGAADAPLGDRRNMVFAGTTVTRGRGVAAVVATGMESEMGRIAGLIEAAGDGPTPLQKRLDQLGQTIVWICLAVCALVVVAGLLRREPLLQMVLAGVSLAVAAIPEGLPAIVTIGLALGVQRMIKGRAIVRRLPAVETLGCATVICSDKTGTLTKNEMTVQRIYAGGRLISVSGEGYRPTGGFSCDGQAVDAGHDRDLSEALRAAVLASNARVRRPRRRGWAALRFVARSVSRGKWAADDWEVQGDPTEAALVAAAMKAGVDPDAAAAQFARLGEVPFESERRRMSTVCRQPGRADLLVCVKGAPDTVLDLCTHYWQGGRAHSLDDARRREILAQNQAMADGALRVLAVAVRMVPSFQPDMGEQVERDLTFLGLFGMIDPPRPEAIEAIARCRTAGLRTVMITGDHLATARAIARQLGLLGQEGAAGLPQQCYTGAKLDAMDDKELREAVADAAVFARVSPQHKLRIVRALKQRGEVVAMTGDGVNDAPAVKEADIGVAMGKTGTDVTKEASAMVLADDNFATIVRAVEEGRAIYDNIRKFIRYLLSCNIGEVLTMFLAAVLGLPLPLLPIQILWVNLVTDGLPAMALGVDPKDPDVMRRPPRRPGESVFSRGLGRKIAIRGALIGIVTTAVFALVYLGEGSLERARTFAFATLVMSQLIHAFDCRSETRTIGEIGWFSNPLLIAAVGVSTAMLAAVLYLPALQPVFKTVPLAADDWMLVLAAASGPSVALWLRRWLRGLRPARLAEVRQ